MKDRTEYIKVDKMISIISKAEKNNLITPRIREIIIQDILHEAERNPYKTP